MPNKVVLGSYQFPNFVGPWGISLITVDHVVSIIYLEKSLRSKAFSFCISSLGALNLACLPHATGVNESWDNTTQNKNSHLLTIQNPVLSFYGVSNKYQAAFVFLFRHPQYRGRRRQASSRHRASHRGTSFPHRKHNAVTPVQCALSATQQSQEQ